MTHEAHSLFDVRTGLDYQRTERRAQGVEIEFAVGCPLGNSGSLEIRGEFPCGVGWQVEK